MRLFDLVVPRRNRGEAEDPQIEISLASEPLNLHFSSNKKSH